MCGIAAIIRSHEAPWDEAERARVGRAMTRLSRRGPDSGAVNWLERGRGVLMHQRLAIQDCSERAAQPMTTPDGTLTLIYNGEIYNAPALRVELEREGHEFRTSSDTEVLLYALGAWGLPRTLEKLRGMFAFAAIVREGDQARVMAAVDPAGMKPLAWRFDASAPGGPILTFASDCDALRELLADKPRLDPASMGQVLSIGYCAPPRTMWEGVNKLPPGTSMEWTLGNAAGPRVSRYWQPPTTLDEASDDHAQERFIELIGEVTREHLIGDVPVGLFLSAGLDSSSIALALKMSGAEMSNITAYTLAAGVPGGPSDESTDAAELASRLGMRHRIVRFASGELVAMVREAANAYDEPQGYSALLTMTRIAQGLRASEPGLKVVLTGDGGDEAFGGYAWHRDASTHPLSLAAFAPPTSADIAENATLAAIVAKPEAGSRERIAAMHSLGRMSYTNRYLTRTFGGFHPTEVSSLLSGISGSCNEDANVSWLSAADATDLPPPRRAQRLDVLGFCAGSILPKVDRACMSVGLEVRSPYLDRRVLEWGLALPVQPIEREQTGSKPVIRGMLARGIESGLVPPNILTRRKQGFSLQTSDRQFEDLTPLVNESRLVQGGLLRRDWAAFLTSEPEMRRVRLLTLAMVAAWHEERA